jgi:hypothetical protein
MSESLDVVTAAFAALPKQFASPKVIEALQKAQNLKIEVPVSEKPLYKFLETFAFVAEDLLQRDPGLLHCMLGMDTQESRERQKTVEDLLEQFLLSAAPAAHIRANIPELPEYHISEALGNLKLRLHRYHGALDAPAFAHWAFSRSVVEAQLLVFFELLTSRKKPFRACVFAGIVSTLERATDICSIDDADDLFSEILELMLGGLAEEFLVPGKASLKTRLRKLGARHAQIYLKALIAERKRIEENASLLEGVTLVSADEKRQIKRKENSERRKWHSRRSASTR